MSGIARLQGRSVSNVASGAFECTTLRQRRCCWMDGWIIENMDMIGWIGWIVLDWSGWLGWMDRIG